MGTDSQQGFVIGQSLRVVLDKLGVVHEELHFTEGKSSLLLAFKKQFLEFEDLQALREILQPKQLRIYSQRYSHFQEKNIDHTGAIWCIDNQT